MRDRYRAGKSKGKKRPPDKMLGEYQFQTPSYAVIIEKPMNFVAGWYRGRACQVEFQKGQT